jgi:drug/metabolite transporter (DMT)-like permease
MSRFVGILYVAVSAFAFGTMAIFARLAYEAGANPMTCLFLRFAIAGLVMAAAMLLKGIPIPKGRNLLLLILMGTIGYVGQSFCFFTSLTLASAGLVAILLYLYPAFVTVLSSLILKTRPSKVKIAALCTSLLGTFIILGGGGEGKPLGIVLALIGPLIYSGYIITGSKVVSKVGAFPSSAVIILSAAAFYSGVVFFQGPSFPQTWAGWVSAVAIALICTVVAIVTFLEGLKRLDPATASIVSTFEPVVTVVLAVLVLGEEITLTKVSGGALILFSLILLTKTEQGAGMGQGIPEARGG